jgi:TPR repeat protein
LDASPTGAQDRPAVLETRKLDPDEIKLLMQRGQQLVASGDLASARVVFQRAAEAGDAAAALAIGSTYDPTVLAKFGMRGPTADAAKARAWYQRAQEFGSPEAARQLELLEHRESRIH